MIEKRFKVDEVAEICGVTPYTVRVWLRDGVLKGIKQNDQWRVEESVLKEYLENKHG